MKTTTILFVPRVRMSRLLMTTAAAIILLGNCVGSARGDLIASYVDGTVGGTAAYVELVNHPIATASNLSNVGGLSRLGSATMGSGAGPGPTPAGPTAGSASGSPWLAASPATTNYGLNPVSNDDYYGFTVSAPVLNLTDLTFDWSNSGNMTSLYTVFASVDGGPFNDMGSDTLVNTITTSWSTVQTEVIDLSSITGAQSVDIRINIADNSGSTSNNIVTILQGIQLNGTAAIPEPSSLGLLGIAGLGLAAYRRRKRKPAA